MSAEKHNSGLRDFGAFISKEVTSMTKALSIKYIYEAKDISRIREIETIELRNEALFLAIFLHQVAWTLYFN